MTTQHPIKAPKKLIEVALPLVAINKASVRESYIYRSNPSSLHKWWAQRPMVGGTGCDLCSARQRSIVEMGNGSCRRGST